MYLVYFVDFMYIGQKNYILYVYLVVTPLWKKYYTSSMVMFLEMNFFFQVCIENFLSFLCQKKIEQGGSLGKGVGEPTLTLLCIKPNKYEINFE